MKDFKEYLEEDFNVVETRGSDYKLYHKSYTDAVNHALDHHTKSGLKASDDDRMHHIGIMSKKPSEGKTTSVNLPATHEKTGKKHMIHMQVYNKGGSHPYELNTYSSTSREMQKEEMGVAGGAIAGIGIENPNKEGQAEPGVSKKMQKKWRNSNGVVRRNTK